jgi:MFS family permease
MYIKEQHHMPENKQSFLLILISQIISLLGGEVLYFAVSLYVLDLTGSAAIFGVMITVSFLPRILLTPLGGAVADRFSKKMILVISDSANTLFIAFLAVMLFAGSESVVLLGATITLMRVMSIIYHPTVTASLPAILKTEELVKANGIVQGIHAVSRLAGPVAAGFLFGAMGVEYLVGVCAVLFLLSSVINIFIKIPYTPQERKGGLFATILSDVKEGFVYIVKVNPMLFKIAVLFSVFILFYQAMLSVGFPYAMRITFSMGEEFFGFANAAIGVAVLAGSIMSGKIRHYMEIKYLPYYFILIGLVTLPVGFSVTLPLGNRFFSAVVMVFGFVLIMFIFTLAKILLTTYTQTEVPPHMVGKTIAGIFTIIDISTPVGLLVLGRLIEISTAVQHNTYMAIAMFTVLLGYAAKKVLHSSYTP